MKAKIDLKSALMGGALGILTMCVIAAESSSKPQPIGRYQIAGGSANGDGHFAVLDTVTGQTWCARMSGNALQPMNTGFTEKKLEH